MTDEARRYRFAASRKAGLFGAIPPTLLITLTTGVTGLNIDNFIL